MPIVRQLAEATIPICRRVGRRVPIPAGSGVLFQIEQHRFLLSASHVFDPTIPPSPLWAIANTHFVNLTGSVWRTRTRAGSNTEERADVAVVPLGPAVGDKWSGCRFLHPADLDPFVRAEEAEPTTGFLAMGYPDTKQPRALRNSSYAPYVHHFVSHREPIQADNDFGGHQELHIAIGFDRTDFAGVNTPQQLPLPRGMSGGGLWRIPRLFTSAHLKAVLVGILIEHRSTHELILATRISELLVGIANRAPEMRPLLGSHFPGLQLDAA